MEYVYESNGEFIGQKTLWKFPKKLSQEVCHIVGLPLVKGIPI